MQKSRQFGSMASKEPTRLYGASGTVTRRSSSNFFSTLLQVRVRVVSLPSRLRSKMELSPPTKVDEPLPHLAVRAVVARPQDCAEFATKVRFGNAVEVERVVARAVAVFVEKRAMTVSLPLRTYHSSFVSWQYCTGVACSLAQLFVGGVHTGRVERAQRAPHEWLCCSGGSHLHPRRRRLQHLQHVCLADKMCLHKHLKVSGGGRVRVRHASREGLGLELCGNRRTDFRCGQLTLCIKSRISLSE